MGIIVQIILNVIINLIPRYFEYRLGNGEVIIDATKLGQIAQFHD